MSDKATLDPQSHYIEKRDKAAAQYQELLANDQPVRLRKSASNLFRERKGKAVRFDARGFNGVVSVDTEKMTAEVEGMAPYRTVVAETLKYGALPAVVPELATITVGGAVSGGGIEATSIYQGLVHETVLAMDILLPTGDVVTATPSNRYKDLFYGMANSFGTLGYILKLTIKLIPAKQYVQVRHFPFTDIQKLLDVIAEVAKTGKYDGQHVDFVDGSGFDTHNLYLTLGTFTDEAPHVSNYTYMQRYYESIQQKSEDYLTARDYIWRWDSDWFWCSKAFYMNRTIPRALLGKWMLRSESYWKLLRLDQKYHMADKIRALGGDHTQLETVIQDVQIPIENAAAFWQFFTKNLTLRPVWFCPTRSKTAGNFPLYTLEPNKTYINFGFWDQVVADPSDPNYYNKLIEKEVTKLGGKKGLYSEVFYSEKEFWRLFGGKEYAKLKAKYDPKGRLKNLYEKCVKQG